MSLPLLFQKFATYIYDVFLVVLDDSLVIYTGRVGQGEVPVFVCQEGGKSCFCPFVESFAQRDAKGVPYIGAPELVDGVVAEIGVLEVLAVLGIILGDVLATIEIQLQRVDETGDGNELPFHFDGVRKSLLDGIIRQTVHLILIET